jgi:hypothetical protein
VVLDQLLGVKVVITIVGDAHLFSAKKLGVFLEWFDPFLSNVKCQHFES